MADVFISYSRRDKEFVYTLHEALRHSNHDTWIDWQDIPITAEWWQEIQIGIEASNTFVFVISPDSVDSKVCNQEIEHAVANNKRLLPIVRRDVEPQKIHLALSKHNWLFFREKDDFDTAFQALIQAIDTDLEHVRTHTRLLVRAKEWDNQNRNDSYLLRGDDLQNAEQWLAQSGDLDPKPTELQIDYISTSRTVEDANRQANQILLAAKKTAERRIRIGSIILVFMLVAAVASGLFAQRSIQAANRKEQEADQRVNDANRQVERAEVEIAQTMAEAKRITAQAERNVASAEDRQRQAEAKVQQAEQNLAAAEQQVAIAAQRVRAVELQADQAVQAQQEAQAAAEQARQDQARAEAARAAAIAAQAAAEQAATLAQAGTRLERASVAALRRFETDQLGALLTAVQAGQDLRRVVAEQQLALTHYPATSPLLALQTLLNSIHERTQLLPSAVAQFSPNNRRIITDNGLWTLDGEQLQQFQGDCAVFSPDGQQVVTKDGLWTLNGEQLQQFRVTSGSCAREPIMLSPDGQYFAIESSPDQVQFWNWNGEQLATLPHEQEIFHRQFSPDGQLFATVTQYGRLQVWNRQGEVVQAFPRLSRYLNQSRQTGQEYQIRALEWSPDGKQVAIALRDASVQVWDLSGRLVQNFPGLNQVMTDLQFSATGQQLAAISISGNYVQFLDLTGRQLPGIDVNTAEFSPDGQSLVTAAAHPTNQYYDVQIWNLSGQVIETLLHEEPVTNIRFSPDGHYMATITANNNLQIWDVQTQPISLWLNQSQVINVQFSPSGQLFSTTSKGNDIHVWNLAGQRLGEFNHQDGVEVVQFSSDDRHLVTATRGNAIRLWALTNPYQPPVLNSALTTTELSLDGRLAAIASRNGTVQVWDITTGENINELAQEGVDLIRFSPDRQHLVTGLDDGTVIIWNADGQAIAQFQHPLIHHPIGLSDIKFSLNGQRLITVSNTRTVRVWNLAGEQLHEFPHQSTADATLSPDGEYLLTAPPDHAQEIVLRHLSSGETHTFEGQLAQFSPEGNRVITPTGLWTLVGEPLATFDDVTIQLSPNGQGFATASKDGVVQFWDWSGQRLVEFQYSSDRRSAGITSMTFSPDGHQLAVVVQEDRTVWVWNWWHQELVELTYQEPVSAVEFSPDGQHLATLHAGRIAYLRNLANQELMPLQHEAQISLLQFSRDRQRIATASKDGVIRLWNLSGQQLAEFTHPAQVSLMQFEPQGEHLLTLFENDVAKLWAVDSLDQLLQKSCGWLQDYLNYSSEVTEDERQLCDPVNAELGEEYEVIVQ